MTTRPEMPPPAVMAANGWAWVADNEGPPWGHVEPGEIRAAMAKAQTAPEPLLSPMADVVEGTTRELLLGRLEPDDHTILFGDGSVGKGVYAAWLAARLTREVHLRVAVIDYEGHARYEWKPRLRQFGADLGLVLVAQPQPRPIWEVADQLADEMAEHGTDYAIVDSVTYACMGQEVEKSVTAARYSVAIGELHLPVLSLAHTTKADADPQHPFGSVFWSNGARLTIGMSKTDDGESRLLKVKKVNARAPFPAQAIDWAWAAELGPSEVPPTLDERAAAVDATARLRDALEGEGKVTAEEAHALVNSDGGKPLSLSGIRKALRSDNGPFWRDNLRPEQFSVLTVTKRSRTSDGVVTEQ
jgi:hypothetical protein